MTVWNKRFMDMAEMVATWSKDPTRKIGAVIVDQNKRVISTGFNGFPRGVSDETSRLEDKEVKRALMIHAEANAISYAKQDITGCSIYVAGYSPCTQCAGLIIQSGIKEVYYKNTREDKQISEYWKINLEQAKTILNEAGVKLIAID